MCKEIKEKDCCWGNIFSQQMIVWSKHIFFRTKPNILPNSGRTLFSNQHFVLLKQSSVPIKVNRPHNLKFLSSEFKDCWDMLQTLSSALLQFLQRSPKISSAHEIQTVHFQQDDASAHSEKILQSIYKNELISTYQSESVFTQFNLLKLFLFRTSG